MSFGRYPEYKDSGVEWLGQVPSHWRASALKYSYEIFGGSTPSSGSPELWDGGVVWVTPADLSRLNGFEILSSQRTISEAGLASCGTRLLPPGTIILSTRAPIGSLGIAGVELATNQGCKGLVPQRGQLSRFGLYSLLVMADELNMRGRGTTFLELSADALGSIEIPTPSSGEQEAIVHFLDHETARIDALVEEQQRLIELLKEKRQAVISHAVTKGLNPDVPMKGSGVEWLGEVPAHWDILPIKRDLVFLTSGSRGWATHYSDDGALFIRIGNLTRDQIHLDLSDLQRVSVPDGVEGERTRVQPGDVLFSITAYLGSVAVVPDGLEQAFVSQHVALARFCKRRLMPKWVAYVTLSDVGKNYLSGEGYGGTKIQLSLEDVAELRTTVPPIQEQAELVAFLEKETAELDALVQEATDVIALLQERRSALISAAVTGKIDVRAWQPPLGASSPAETTETETA